MTIVSSSKELKFALLLHLHVLSCVFGAKNSRTRIIPRALYLHFQVAHMFYVHLYFLIPVRVSEKLRTHVYFH